MRTVSWLHEAEEGEHAREGLRLLNVPSRGAVEAQLESLKNELLEPILKEEPDASLARELSWAATEAAALAWYTGHPVLVFPALLAEKVAAARAHWERQQRLWDSLAA